MSNFMSKFGANIAESMRRGDRVTGPGQGPAIPAPGQGGEADRYRGIARVREALSIPTDQLRPDPDQPRQEFDQVALEQLAESLRRRGQLQAIRVRWDAAGSGWVIVAGERRWRAATMAGIANMTAIECKGELTPADLLEDQLVENLLREDLKPMEQALAYRRLLDARGCTITTLSEDLKVSRQNIMRALSLLDLPEDVQAHVDSGALPPSTAAEVAKLADPETVREVAKRILAADMPRGDAVELIREVAAARPMSTEDSRRGPKGLRGVKKPGRAIQAKPVRIRVDLGTLTLELKRGWPADPRNVLAMLTEAREAYLLRHPSLAAAPEGIPAVPGTPIRSDAYGRGA